MYYKKIITVLTILILNTTSFLPSSFLLNNKEDIINRMEQALASKDEEFQVETKLDIANSVTRIFANQADADILKNQYKEKIILLLKQGLTGPLADFSYSATLHLISGLIAVEILTVQDKKDIMPILKQAIASRNNYATSIFSAVSKLANKNILTAEDVKDIMPYLKTTMNNVDIFTKLDVISSLAKAHLLTMQDKKNITPMFEYLLKKDFIFNLSQFSFESSIESATLEMVCDLTKAKIVSIQEIMPLLKKGLTTKNDSILKSTKNIICELTEAKILTTQDKEKLLASK